MTKEEFQLEIDMHGYRSFLIDGISEASDLPSDISVHRYLISFNEKVQAIRSDDVIKLFGYYKRIYIHMTGYRYQISLSRTPAYDYNGTRFLLNPILKWLDSNKRYVQWLEECEYGPGRLHS